MTDTSSVRQGYVYLGFDPDVLSEYATTEVARERLDRRSTPRRLGQSRSRGQDQGRSMFRRGFLESRWSEASMTSPQPRAVTEADLDHWAAADHMRRTLLNMPTRSSTPPPERRTARQPSDSTATPLFRDLDIGAVLFDPENLPEDPTSALVEADRQRRARCTSDDEAEEDDEGEEEKEEEEEGADDEDQDLSTSRGADPRFPFDSRRTPSGSTWPDKSLTSSIVKVPFRMAAGKTQIGIEFDPPMCVHNMLGPTLR